MFGPRSELESLPEISTEPPEELIPIEAAAEERQQVEASLVYRQVYGDDAPTPLQSKIRELAKAALVTQDKHIEAAADALTASVLENLCIALRRRRPR